MLKSIVSSNFGNFCNQLSISAKKNAGPTFFAGSINNAELKHNFRCNPYIKSVMAFFMYDKIKNVIF